MRYWIEYYKKKESDELTQKIQQYHDLEYYVTVSLFRVKANPFYRDIDYKLSVFKYKPELLEAMK